MSRGRFIVVEGAEGVGKSTQAARLAAFLRSRGITTELVREPGGTVVGEGIRGLVLAGGEAIPRETELLLIVAARAAFVRQRVEPALSEGTWVVSDRYDLSTFAYQGHGRGIDLDWIERVNRYATAGLTPDLYLVLDLPVRDGMTRLERKDRPLDRIESETLGFLRKVRRGYVELAGSVACAELVSASGRPDEVEARIRDVITGYFPDSFSGRGSGGPGSRNTETARGAREMR